jgi:APA family basic amino acid/polyamine antiporter
MLALGRDGLVPNSFFGNIHPKWRTPWKSTILTGLFVATMAGFIPLSILAEMTSIGTLFAFVIVCGAVLVMRRTNPDAHRPFRCPLVPVVPILGILTCLLLMFSLPYENWVRLIVWLAVGLLIYFGYGRRHSVMSQHTEHEIKAHGISPAGQAVADPDAPPGSPAGDVDPRVK